MVVFKRAGKPVMWGYHIGDSPGPCTWRPVSHTAADPPIVRADLVYSTCPKGHECRISKTVHSIADDGTLSPSYVCPIEGCGFHAFVRFDGWKQKELN